MSRTKIASHYYNLGRQQAARDLLGGLTKTAAPSSRELRQLAALGGAGLLGAGIANSKAIGGGIDAAISRAAGAGRTVTDPATYLAMLNEAQAALQAAMIQGNIKGSQGLDSVVSALNRAGSKLRGISPHDYKGLAGASGEGGNLGTRDALEQMLLEHGGYPQMSLP
jgi:hypothetical protein